MPTSRRISVSAPRPICSIVSSTSRVAPRSVVEHAPLGACLHDHHRDVVGDRVVQLARDPRALLDDRLARGDVALPLGELRAPLAVADDAADEQHHHERDDCEGHAVGQSPGRPGRRGEVADEHEHRHRREPARRRPDRQSRRARRARRSRYRRSACRPRPANATPPCFARQPRQTADSGGERRRSRRARARRAPRRAGGRSASCVSQISSSAATSSTAARPRSTSTDRPDSRTKMKTPMRTGSR